MKKKLKKKKKKWKKIEEDNCAVVVSSLEFFRISFCGEVEPICWVVSDSESRDRMSGTPALLSSLSRGRGGRVGEVGEVGFKGIAPVFHLGP